MVASTAFFQSVNFFKDGISFVNQMNESLTQLSIVYMKGQEEVAKYAQTFHELGMEMGISSLAISKGASEFARQGLSETEMLSKMQTAIRYSAISSIDFATSAKILTATVNALGVEAERAADVYSYLGDATASGADEIGMAMQRMGGSIGATNVEFEKAASWVASISSRTRESAFTIGKLLPHNIAIYYAYSL